MGYMPDLPDAVRDAAHRYLSAVRANPERNDAALALLGAFGLVQSRNLEHRRMGRLCILATRRILPAWTDLPCDNAEPLGAVRVSVKWLSAGTPSHSWERICQYSHPRYRGVLLYNCLTPRLSGGSLAAAATAQFARFGRLSDAAEALYYGWFATDEGFGEMAFKVGATIAET